VVVPFPFSRSGFSSASASWAAADGLASSEEEGEHRRRTHLTVGPLFRRTLAICSPVKLDANSVVGSILVLFEGAFVEEKYDIVEDERGDAFDEDGRDKGDRRSDK